MRLLRSIFWLLASGCWLVLFTGCTSPYQKKVDRAVADYFHGRYEQSIGALRPIAKITNEDFVLNNCRLGSSALADYRFDDAEAAFLNAYEVINSMDVNNGGRTLGATVVAEKLKIWKGEPFERAMANFYLGLVYYIRHDYNNARAAFENALFKLHDYGKENDRRDNYQLVESKFALAQLMLARCWQRLGREDLARANFDAVARFQPNLAPLCDYRRNLDANFLLVVDYGYGPEKITTWDNSLVGFAPLPQQQGPIPIPTFIIDGKAHRLNDIGRPTIDLLALAQDRRWQDIDTIRAIKSAIGTGLIAAGAVEGVRGMNPHSKRQSTDLAVAAGLIGTGLLLKASATADTRYWEMLPRTVFILPLRVPPGSHEITIDFPDIPGLRQTWQNFPIPPTGETTLFIRPQRYNAGPFSWPPPSLAPPPQPNRAP